MQIPVDPTVILFVITLINSVAAFLLWLRKPGQDASTEIAAFKSAAAEVAGGFKGRLDVLEERVAHMPTDEELAHLKGEMHGLSAQLSGMSEQMLPVRQALDRIQHYLLTERHK